MHNILTGAEGNRKKGRFSIKLIDFIKETVALTLQELRMEDKDGTFWRVLIQRISQKQLDSS